MLSSPPRQSMWLLVCVCVCVCLTWLSMCGIVPPAAGVCVCVCCSFGGMVKGCGLPQCLWAGQKVCVCVCVFCGHLAHSVFLCGCLCVWALWSDIVCLWVLGTGCVSVSLCESDCVCLSWRSQECVWGHDTADVCILMNSLKTDTPTPATSSFASYLS